MRQSRVSKNAKGGKGRKNTKGKTVKKEKKKNKEKNSSDKKKKNDGGSKGGKEAEAQVTPRSEDFSKWYLDVIRECELADYGPARGTMVIRPYGFAMWETTQTILNEQFGMRGVENCYFPQLIPY